MVCSLAHRIVPACAPFYVGNNKPCEKLSLKTESFDGILGRILDDMLFVR
jgi:hypothetical protein